jgi:DNA-binding GntR family transcriptional regulator
MSVVDDRAGASRSMPGGGDARFAPYVRSATDHAREMVRELIESGEFKPGEKLNPDDLAARLNVSRTPVRDALHQLRNEGLVDIRPRNGVFVRDISAREIEEVYALKAAIEPLAARWAALNGNDEQKAQLAAHADTLAKAGAARNLPLAAEQVGQIHDLMMHMSGSAVLHDVYRVFQGRVRMLRHINMAQPGRLASSVAQHQAIVECIVAGDEGRAEQTMRDHMTDALRSVRAALDVPADDNEPNEGNG